MSKEGRKTRDKYDYPCNGYGHERVLLSTDGDGGDGVDDGEEAVKGHENERVDAGVGRHNDEILDHLAPGHAEGPVGEDVVGGREWDAEDDEEEVGNGEVDDEKIGCIPHLLVRGHHDHHQRIPKEAHNEDDPKENRDYEGHDPFQLVVMLILKKISKARVNVNFQFLRNTRSYLKTSR